jgi:hypothetical protein
LQSLDKSIKFPNRNPETDADKALVNQVVQQVETWYKKGDENELVIAEQLNPFQRSLVYTALRDLRLGGEGWRGFVHQRAGKWASQGIKLTMATREEADVLEAKLRKQKIAEVRVCFRAWIISLGSKQQLFLFVLCGFKC